MQARRVPPDRPPAALPVLPTWTLVKVALRLALILMTLSLLLPCARVESPAELREVGLGLPVPFVTLDASRLRAAGLPQCVRFGTPGLDPMRLRPVAAIVDLGALTLGVMLLARAMGIGWRSKPRRRS